MVLLSSLRSTCMQTTSRLFPACKAAVATPLTSCAFRGLSTLTCKAQPTIINTRQVSRINSYTSSLHQFQRAYPVSKKALSTIANEKSPLRLAVIKGRWADADLLIKSAANIAVNQNGNILHLAIQHHQNEFVTLLFKNYPDKALSLIEGTNDMKRTPLMVAAHLGNVEAFELLHAYGAVLEKPQSETDKEGRQPLHLAAIQMHKPIIDLLAYYGCSLQPKDKYGKRPEDYLQEIDTPESRSLYLHLQNLQTQEIRIRERPQLYSNFLPQNLVFKGGGPKGIAFVGALKVLEDQNRLREVKRIAGTSAGAIQATFQAFRIDSNETEKHLEKNFADFFDHPLTLENLYKKFLNSGVSLLQDIYQVISKGPVQTFLSRVPQIIESLRKTTGACEGEKFREWIEKIIAEKSKTPHMTFGELRKKIHEQQGKGFRHLHVYTSDLKSQKPVHINSEDPQWDDIIISDAVRASMSIPFVFKPHILHKKVYKANNTYDRVAVPELGSHVDGGLLENFPLDTFDKPSYFSTNLHGDYAKGTVFNPRTLGFGLYSSVPQPPPKNTENIKELISGIISYFLEISNLVNEKNPHNKYRVINIDHFDVGLLDFNLPKEKKDALVASGREATLNFYKDKDRLLSKENPTLFHRLLMQRVKLTNLPQPHPHFIDRPTYYSQLETRLLPKTTSLSKVILAGVPGSGKREMAIEFANRYRQRFSLAWWLDNGTSEKLEKGYQELAQAMQIKKTANDKLQSLVHDRLTRFIDENKRFLLVYDSWDENVELPIGRYGSLLLLSRSNKVVPGELRVEPFTENEAIKLVQKVIRYVMPLDAKQLVNFVGTNPLPLHQAASYIANTPGMTVKKYAAILENFKEVLPTDSVYPKSFVAIWKSTAAAIKSEDPSAYEWLSICSCLSGSSIPTFWIEYWTEQIRPASSPSLHAERRDTILNILSKYGIVRSNNGSIFLHELYSNIVKVGRSAEIEKKAVAFIRTLGEKIQDDKVAFELWEPHARTVLSLASISAEDKKAIEGLLKIKSILKVPDWVLSGAAL